MNMFYWYNPTMRRRKHEAYEEIKTLARAGVAAGLFASGSNWAMRKLGLGFATRSALMTLGGTLAGLAVSEAGFPRAGSAFATATLAQGLLYAGVYTGLMEPLENRIMEVPPYLLALYGGTGLRNAYAYGKPIAQRLDVRGLILHGSSDELINDAPAMVADIRAALPKAKVWNELEDDAGPANSVLQLSRRLAVAQATVNANVKVLSLDREARWKLGIPGFLASDARASITAIRKAHPTLGLTLTNYDQPTLHDAFPWQANAGVDAYEPEVYGSGVAGEYQRFIDHATSWAIARKLGMVSGATTYPYVPAGGITAEEICWMADGSETILLWVLAPPGTNDSMILDAQGELAIRYLNKLTDDGYVGVGRVSRFQRDHNLTEIDGKIGPRTKAALGF